MPKVITGVAAGAAFEIAENPVWGVAYYRKRTVERKSAKVKAINVCLKARKLLGEPAPATLAKKKKEWNQGKAGKKAALSKAMREVLNDCKNNAQKYCDQAAGQMGLSKEECVKILGQINVTSVTESETRAQE